MDRVERQYTPRSVVHLSSRTRDGQLILTPSAKLNGIIAGIVGHFAASNGIVLFCYVFMANHFHMLAMGPSQKALSTFLGCVKKQITDSLKRLHGWRHRVSLWDSRFDQVEVLDDVSVGKTFEYIISNGVKEGLVARPEQWPGLTTAHEVSTGQADRGVWVRTTEYKTALCRDKTTRIEDFTEHHELRCAPLPDLEGRGDVLRWQGTTGPKLLSSIAMYWKLVRLSEGQGSVKGVAAVLSQDPFRRLPKVLDRLPVCVTVSKALEREYLEARRNSSASYHYAKAMFLSERGNRPLSELIALFPSGACIGHAGWCPIAA